MRRDTTVMYVRSVRRGFLYTGHMYNLGSFTCSAEFTAYRWITGRGVKSTLAGGSVSLQPLRSHPAPSRYRPCTYTPSAGGWWTSSFIILVTSLCRMTESSAQPLCARVTSCLIAVRKPCGLKKPVIQKTFGRAVKIHLENWLFRSISSVNQKPSVEDSQDT